MLEKQLLKHLSERNDQTSERALGQAWLLLATIQDERGKLEDAVVSFREAAGYLSGEPNAVTALATALWKVGRSAEAEALLDKLLKEKRSLRALQAVAQARLDMNHAEDAVRLYRSALAANPEGSGIRFYLATALEAAGNSSIAAEHYSSLVNDPKVGRPARKNLAWIWATDPDASLRNGSQAVKLADQNCALSNYTEPVDLDVLAAALADTGQFDAAIERSASAIHHAKATGQLELAAQIENRLKNFYSNQMPYRSGGNE